MVVGYLWLQDKIQMEQVELKYGTLACNAEFALRFALSALSTSLIRIRTQENPHYPHCTFALSLRRINTLTATKLSASSSPASKSLPSPLPPHEHHQGKNSG